MKITSFPKVRFHVIVITQINKSVVHFIVNAMLNLDVPNADLCTNFDVKSGLHVS